jgi:hypothetical protein
MKDKQDKDTGMDEVQKEREKSGCTKIKRKLSFPLSDF